METFRRMLNDCIKIGLEENKTSFMSLRYACYPKLKAYNIASAYKNNAISRASGILSSYKKAIEERKTCPEAVLLEVSIDNLLRLQKERRFDSTSLEGENSVERLCSQTDSSLRNTFCHC